MNEEMNQEITEEIMEKLNDEISEEPKEETKEGKAISKGKRIFVIVITTVLMLLILVGAGVVIWVNQTLNLINRDTSVDVTLSDEEIESLLQETDPVDEMVEPLETVETTELVETTEALEETEPDVEDAVVLEEEDSIINILLIGQDRLRGQKRQRSDSMILCTVNLEEKTLVLTSFLRDTYVKIPAWEGKKYGKNRLNVCYAVGGMEMLDQCLLDNFGVQVDYNIEVDFDSFVVVTDALGGIDMELTQKEANHMNHAYGLGGQLQEGMNHLNGELALFYARIRKLDSDFARTDRQRKVVLALMENAKDMSLSQVIDIVVDVFPMITTDMSNGAIYKLAMKMLPVLSDLEITSQHIPAEGTYYFGQVPGMSAITIDLEANRQILRDTIGMTEAVG